MSNRKCGTCRFYEAGTQQSHGWCRNPANPRRDEVALLRPEELGCRAGWGKDFWAAGEGEEADTAPIPIVAVAPATPDVLVASSAPPKPEVAPATPVATPSAAPANAGAAPLSSPARRKGFQGPMVAAAPIAPPVTAKETAVNFDAALSGHPELGENGVPLRNTRRSAVAEAHRRALERREQERLAVQERVAVQERPMPQERATPPVQERTQRPATPPPPAGATQITPGLRSTFGQPSLTFTLDTSQRETPRPTPIPVSEPAPPPAVAPIPEAVDRHISTVESAIQDGPRAESAPPRPAPVEPAPVVPASPVAPPVPETVTARPSITASSGEAATSPAPTAAPTYWDQLPGGNRFTRMREVSAEPPVSRPEPRTVSNIGRQRQELPPPADSPPTRTIRPLSPLTSPGTATPAPRAEAVAEPVQVARPTPAPPEVRPAPPPAPPPAPEVVTPRPIDDALLRQLEADWRVQALEAHAGQRCNSCRFFQAGEGSHGTCGCAFTAVYRRPVESQDLGCLNSLGSWWAASDDGWLERTERRPRRATPLLDALLREYEAEEAARANSERRRSAR